MWRFQMRLISLLVGVDFKHADTRGIVLLGDGMERQHARLDANRGFDALGDGCLEGLQIGDEVILSDMTAWDAYDRLRLN